MAAGLVEEITAIPLNQPRAWECWPQQARSAIKLTSR